MSCCYCITRARSITACVDCSLQAKTVLSNSIFLHYTFFFLPKACVSHRCSSYTNIIHVQQVAVTQGLSLLLTPSGEDTVTSLGSTNSSWLCPVSTPNQPPQQALPCPLSAPNLYKFRSPHQAQVWEQQGTTSPFSKGQNCGIPEQVRLEQSTGAHLVPPPCQPGPCQSTGLQPDSSGMPPVRETPHPQLCQTSAALSIALVFRGHC